MNLVRGEERVNGSSTWRVRTSIAVSYEITESDDVLDPGNPTLATAGGSPGTRRFVVIDEALLAIHGDRVARYFEAHDSPFHLLPIHAGETSKDLHHFQALVRQLDRFTLARRDEPIVAIGGGVLTDVVGFVASTYRRGVPYVRVPTTLMGYIDAALGVKTGINFDGAKNRIGTFAPPAMTVLDRRFLSSLPDRHLRNGIGEIIKLAVVKDAALFEDLERCGTAALADQFQTVGHQLLERAITGMLDELVGNLFEESLERPMDFGHTFSPHLEMANVVELLHGEAVAIDVAFSTVLAEARGLLGAGEATRVLDLCTQLGLPTNHHDLQPALLWEGLQERTAHRGGLQRVPVPAGIGACVFLNDISYAELAAAAETLSSRSTRRLRPSEVEHRPARAVSG